ncbi:MAG TPA: hypothetical protein GX513_14020, partial [Firmicutes bacterium]|nr:hypothetical protein [Bacillota bacterium]
MTWWQQVDAWGFSLAGSLSFPGVLPVMIGLSSIGSFAGVVALAAMASAWLTWVERKAWVWGLWLVLEGGWGLEAGVKALV